MKDSDDPASSSQYVRSTQAVDSSVGERVHVAGIFNASENRMALVIDGQQVATGARSAASWQANGAFTVGCAIESGSDVGHLAADVSDVRVWRGVLSAGQVAEVRTGLEPVKTLAFWPLNGPGSSDPTLLADVANPDGNGHGLVLGGEPEWVRGRFGREGALALKLQIVRTRSGRSGVAT